MGEYADLELDRLINEEELRQIRKISPELPDDYFNDHDDDYGDDYFN